MPVSYPLLLLVALTLGPLPVVADVLVIDHTNQYATMHKPGNGLTMAEVESSYGSPLEKRPAVGNPPITQWVYGGFVVYFEYDRVIHSVAKRSANP